MLEALAVSEGVALAVFHSVMVLAGIAVPLIVWWSERS
jgi:hypothetical protein